jgi:hypothetical protein
MKPKLRNSNAEFWEFEILKEKKKWMKTSKMLKAWNNLQVKKEGGDKKGIKLEFPKC